MYVYVYTFGSLISVPTRLFFFKKFSNLPLPGLIRAPPLVEFATL